jgi:Reverse transcriptase (RNA-dependent DNA polymerase).
MVVVLKNLVGTDCWVFIDDVIIFSKSAQVHAQRLENVLQMFDKTNLQLNPGKFVFAQPQVQYFKFILYAKGVSASPDKVKVVRDNPTAVTNLLCLPVDSSDQYCSLPKETL